VTGRCTWQDQASSCPVHGDHLTEAEREALSGSTYAQLEELRASLGEAVYAARRELGLALAKLVDRLLDPPRTRW
jgi:hypothetical protein